MTPYGQKRGTCAQCGKAMWRGQTSLPQGQARCQPCRRMAAGRKPNQPAPAKVWGYYIRYCRKCGELFSCRRSRQRFCGNTCRQAARATRPYRFSTARPTGRGYGGEHQKARRAAAAQHQPTDRCHLCGDTLGPMGSHLHYDHNEERDGYRGFAHARCNIRDGARRGARRGRPTPSPRWHIQTCSRGCCETYTAEGA